MKIEEIKREMLNFRDFYGGDLLGEEEIRNAKSKKELAELVEKHRTHMEMMLCDANAHLDNFKKKVGLSMIW